MLASSAVVNSSKIKLTGWLTKIVKLPRERIMARLKCFSIIGPRMKPSANGAGGQPSRLSASPNSAKKMAI